MATLILSGGAYGANWLPLILPLVAIAAIIKGVDLLSHFLRKRKLRKANELMEKFTVQLPDETNNIGEQP